MGLFGNNDKKIKELNDANKKAILAKIEMVKLNVTGDPNVLQLLSHVSTSLMAQTSSKDKEVAKIDVQILSLLNDVVGDVIKSSSVAAVNKLDKVVKLVIERRKYCLSGGHLTKDQEKALDKINKQNKKFGKRVAKENPQTRQEALIEELTQKQVELDEAEQEFARLKERNEKAPNDASIMAQGIVVKSRMDLIKSEIEGLKDEVGLEAYRDAINKIAAQKEELSKGRTISDDQHQVDMETFRAVQEKSQAEQSTMKANMSEVFGSADANASVNPFADSAAAQSNGFNPFAEKKTESKNSFDHNALGTPEMRGEIARTKAALERSIEKYEERIDDQEDELKDLEADLRPLLLQRKTATPSECLVLDGRIDALQSKRSGIQNAIRQYRQGKATLEERMRLMDRLEIQQDLEQTQSQIENITEGKFQDYEGLAMYLKTAIQEGNQKLEEIGMAGMVADSEEINMNTMSGLSAQAFDAPENKDESKYDALMKDMGLN